MKRRTWGRDVLLPVIPEAHCPSLPGGLLDALGHLASRPPTGFDPNVGGTATQVIPLTKLKSSGPPNFREGQGCLVVQSLQVIEGIGRGEWIRTTGLLVPNQTTPAISLITERIFSQETSF